MSEHEYLRRLRAAGIVLRHGVTEAFVAHDEPSCGIYKGHHCDCDPDITVKIDGRTFAVLRDGQTKELS